MIEVKNLTKTLRRQGRRRRRQLHRPARASSPASSARTAPASRPPCGRSSAWTDPIVRPGHSSTARRTRDLRRPLLDDRRPARRTGGGHAAAAPATTCAPSAATVGIGDRRVEQVLELVGLTDVADRGAGGYSLGMGQRLGIAAALLGDPDIVMLDEPVNGLDPDGVLWIRDAAARPRRRGPHRVRLLAPDERDGADRRPPVVIGRGRLIADEPMAELPRRCGEENRVCVTAPRGRPARRAPDRPGRQRHARRHRTSWRSRGIPAADHRRDRRPARDRAARPAPAPQPRSRRPT